jgi:transposase
MHMLAELVDLVIGVDTHKHTHTAAVVMAATGALVAQVTVPATRSATGNCCGWPTDRTAGGCGRSRAAVAMAPA